MILVLAAHTKQFKDSNFNVLKAAFIGIRTLLEATHEAGTAKGNHAAVSTVISPAVEKLGDRKLQVKFDNAAHVGSQMLSPMFLLFVQKLMITGVS